MEELFNWSFSSCDCRPQKLSTFFHKKMVPNYGIGLFYFCELVFFKSFPMYFQSFFHLRISSIFLGAFVVNFLHSVFSNVSSKCLHRRMRSHIGCICSTFLRCVFSNVSSIDLPNRMHSHTGCIRLAFLHCVTSKQLRKGKIKKRWGKIKIYIYIFIFPKWKQEMHKSQLIWLPGRKS